jgi:hypothetical protein
MTWYAWFTTIAFAAGLAGMAFHAVRLLRAGPRKDFARSSGSRRAGVGYSFTRGMDPRTKESAYLHLPTYAAGLIYHAGTFAAILIFVLLFFFGVRPEGAWTWILVVVLAFSFSSGLGILVKRIALGKLRALSVPDDYISNVLLTVFHLLSIRALVSAELEPAYYLWSGILLLYAPFGKLRHAVYFIAARVRAGAFYGGRGVWPAARR